MYNNQTKSKKKNGITKVQKITHIIIEVQPKDKSANFMFFEISLKWTSTFDPKSNILYPIYHLKRRRIP